MNRRKFFRTLGAAAVGAAVAPLALVATKAQEFKILKFKGVTVKFPPLEIPMHYDRARYIENVKFLRGQQY